jgi:hypothetical protein
MVADGHGQSKQEARQRASAVLLERLLEEVPLGEFLGSRRSGGAAAGGGSSGGGWVSRQQREDGAELWQVPRQAPVPPEGPGTSGRWQPPPPPPPPSLPQQQDQQHEALLQLQQLQLELHLQQLAMQVAAGSGIQQLPQHTTTTSSSSSPLAPHHGGHQPGWQAQQSSQPWQHQGPRSELAPLGGCYELGLLPGSRQGPAAGAWCSRGGCIDQMQQHGAPRSHQHLQSNAAHWGPVAPQVPQLQPAPYQRAAVHGPASSSMLLAVARMMGSPGPAGSQTTAVCSAAQALPPW